MVSLPTLSARYEVPLLAYGTGTAGSRPRLALVGGLGVEPVALQLDPERRARHAQASGGAGAVAGFGFERLVDHLPLLTAVRGRRVDGTASGLAVGGGGRGADALGKVLRPY